MNYSQCATDGKLIMLCVSLAMSQHAAALNFEDVTTAAGISAPHLANKPATGIAVADFDRNGWPDLFMTGYQPENKLFLNQGDGSFLQSPYNGQLALPNAQCGSVAAADFDNDGWQDLYLACWGRNYLFHNLQGQGFADITATAGVDHDGRTEAVGWGDINGDGWLDLVVGVHPLQGEPDPADPYNWDMILFNNGDGTFTNIAHLMAPEQLVKLVLGVIISDIDLDGDQDLYVVNDKLVGNTLWRNDGPGCGGWCMTDISAATGTDRAAYSMGITVGDCDRDGDWDLVYSSIGEQILLRGQQAQGSFTFDDVGADSGISFPAIGWGVVFFDGDNDGWEDLFLATTGSSPGIADRLFYNETSAQFSDVSQGSNMDRDDPTEAAAWLDYDRDGRLDLAVGLFNMSYRLNRNVTPNTGNWLGLSFEGGGAINRDALGTRVVVTMNDGSRQMRELRSGESRGSSHDKVLHFGLGTDTGVSQITVYWPDGLVENLGPLPANQYHHRIYPPIEVLLEDAFE